MPTNTGSVWKTCCESRSGVEDGLDELVFVRPDGKVTFPLVNDIQAAGLTADQVREQVTEALSGFIREPQVTVIVEEINSFRVFILGEVAEQGALNFQRPTRLLQAIAAAGGFTDFSNKEIVVLRQAGDGEERIRINYKRVMAGETPEHNIFLQPGDTLLVD